MVATFSSQLRIRNFRKKHNNSYFRKYRQNIATINQLLVAVYLTLLTALFKEGIVMTILLNYPPTVSYDTFLKINNLLNCIIIPSYWTKSTKNEFEDFWSIQTCFWKTKPKALSKSMDVEIVPLEPRRPSFSITLITYEGTQHKLEASIPGRYSYGLNILKPIKHPKRLASISNRNTCQDIISGYLIDEDNFY